MYLGIEIGGTKLQLAVGRGDGHLLAQWRGIVAVEQGGDGIRRQILNALPELCTTAQIAVGDIRSAGIGFGGPVDDTTQAIIKSHQIAGWDGFPIVMWFQQATGLPTRLGNDADVAGLAEAMWGAGQGCSPLLYMTLGSGIGGGLILNGAIMRGTGRGAAEIGHLRVRDALSPTGELASLESIASGWGIGDCARRLAEADPVQGRVMKELANGQPIMAPHVATAARQGDALARRVLQRAISALADGIGAAIVLVCPQRIVIGGGVSLMGDDLIFDPLRTLVSERVFAPFAGLADIVSAQLGEEVVIHGALALAVGAAR